VFLSHGKTFSQVFSVETFRFISVMIFLSDLTPSPRFFLTRLHQIPFDKLLNLAFSFLENVFANVHVHFSVRVYQDAD